MAHRIITVEPGSIADQCGLVAGDALVSINAEPVLDQVDYQFLTAQEHLVLEIEKASGEITELELEKDESEPLGVIFGSTLMSRPRTCVNHCVFCFIDQMPEGLRDTLYVKDDDWRLSLMMGNYITLTNLSEKEFQRIIDRKASPLFISIHATDGAVRAEMMGNARATNIMAQLRRLAQEGITFHCQIVLCPGINDGDVLDDTLQTLSALYPAAQSAALVPVGLTAHRDGLAPLRPYTTDTARQVIAQARGWQNRLQAKLGTRFAFPADEFYCLSGEALPPDEAYEGYPQIENGVGLLRGFEKEYATAYRFADMDEVKPRSVIIATGVSVARFLRQMIAEKPIPGVKVTVLPVENCFFGPSVTVAGLLTGQDLRRTLAGRQTDEILISQAMLRHDGQRFLDDDSLPSLSAALGIPVHAVDCDGAEFFYALQGERYETEAQANG